MRARLMTAGDQADIERLGLVAALMFVQACSGLADEPRRRVEDSTPVFDASAEPTAPGGTAEHPAEPEPEPPFEDPGCEEDLAPIVEMDCDPFDPVASCDSGQACRPFVQYPSSPCEPERFGSRCEWPGTGQQGDACGLEACAAGLLCVATGQGTQCAQVCPLPSASGCAPGLVCGSIDIEGIGTCF